MILLCLPTALSFAPPVWRRRASGAFVSARGATTRPMDTKGAQEDIVNNWLQTLHIYPVDYPTTHGLSLDSTVNIELHEKGNRAKQKSSFFQNRCFKIITGILAVALVTRLLCLGTARLDVLAHSASSLLASPSLMVAALAGAGAGSLHTLSGPDHLALLTPLALRVRGPSAAFRTGVFWGSGHVVGQLLLGMGMVLVGRSGIFSNLISAMGVGAFAEQAAVIAVGAVLLLIGCLGIKESREWQDDEEVDAEETFSWKTFGTGMLSGMHPDALLLCLPALALPTRLASFSFLAAFGAGTLAAMGGYTAALHTAARALGQRSIRHISMVASGVAIAVGGAICASAFGVPMLGGFM